MRAFGYEGDVRSADQLVRLADHFRDGPVRQDLIPIAGVVALAGFVLQEQTHGVDVAQLADEDLQASTSQFSRIGDQAHAGNSLVNVIKSTSVFSRLGTV